MRVVGGTTGLRVAVATMVLAVSACGGSKAEDASGNPASGGGVTSTTAAPDSGQSSKPSDGVSKQPSKSTTTTTLGGTGTAPTQIPPTGGDKPLPPLPMTAELKESCVRPGGKQTITIRTEPESGVGYDAIYSDGKGGAMEGHYGGNKGGQVDEDGTFTDTWVVAPNAPAGQVKVNVLGGKMGYEHAEAYAYFSVADLTGKCA